MYTVGGADTKEQKELVWIERPTVKPMHEGLGAREGRHIQ